MSVKKKKLMGFIILIIVVIINMKIHIIPYDNDTKIHIWNIRPTNIQRINFVCLSYDEKTNYIEGEYKISKYYYVSVPIEKYTNFSRLHDEKLIAQQSKKHVYRIYDKDNNTKGILYFR